MNTLGHDQPRGRRAALAGGKERAVDRAFHCHLQVSIVENNKRILAAHLKLKFLHRPRRNTGRRDLMTCCDRTGKADRRDARMLQQCGADLRATTDHEIEHTLRQAGTMQDIDQRPGRTRHQICRLDHHGVAIGQRRRNLPGRNCDREIPRRDQADDAQPFAGDLDVDAGAHRGQLLAGHTQAFPGEERKDLSCARGLANALGQGLALLARQQPTEFILTRQNFVRGLLQYVVTELRRRARPCRECRPGRGDSSVGLGAGAAHGFADYIIGIRRIDVGRTCAIGNPFSVDQIIKHQHGVVSLLLYRVVAPIDLLETGASITAPSSAATRRNPSVFARRSPGKGRRCRGPCAPPP